MTTYKAKTMKVEGKEAHNSTEQKPKTVFPDSTSDLNSKVYAGPIVDSEDSDDDAQSISIKVGNHDIKNQIVTNTENTKIVQEVNVLQHVFNATNSAQTLGNVFIERSNGVHIGNITYVTGPIHITNSSSNLTHPPECSEKPACSTKSTTDAKPSSSNETEKRSCPVVPPDRRSDASFKEEEVEREEVNRSDAFIGNIHRAIDGNVLRIVNRMTWLAQRPFEPYDYIGAPAQYVIISHTGTEEGKTQAENVFLVRNIQCFHVESRRWNDIAYNFLIGSDGNVYEGRGWNVVGAHTYGYNKKSIGISFIGCFMKDKAPQISIKACKLLIQRGIELGHIHPNYILLAHCQCSATESPGRMLFEEMQTWPQFSLHPTI